MMELFSSTFAQLQSEQSDYFMRALKEASNGNKAEALVLLNKELKENPSNGYAYMALALVNTETENYSEAMNAINIAIKKLPKEDKETMCGAYVSRAHIYTAVGDTVKALSDYNQAMIIDSANEYVLNEYGQLLYDLQRYDEAYNTYSK